MSQPLDRQGGGEDCPLCGLPMDKTFDAEGNPQPSCNPIRSPDCWSVIAILPKSGSVESRVIRAAERNQG